MSALDNLSPLQFLMRKGGKYLATAALAGVTSVAGGNIAAAVPNVPTPPASTDAHPRERRSREELDEHWEHRTPPQHIHSAPPFGVQGHSIGGVMM